LSSARQIGSPGKVLSDQLIRWCCNDRLSSQPLPEKWVLVTKFPVIRRMAATAILPEWLLLKDQRRTADAFDLEGDGHFDAIGNLDEGNAAIHSVFFAVEGHRPVNGAGA
jgi:hypothetical protein